MIRHFVAALFLPLLASTSQAAIPVATPPGADCAGRPTDRWRSRATCIGGIGQWVTIEGARCSNPVVLVVHGGPGNPLSPYAHALYEGWTRDFTLVQWDQRGIVKVS